MTGIRCVLISPRCIFSAVSGLFSHPLLYYHPDVTNVEVFQPRLRKHDLLIGSAAMGKRESLQVLLSTPEASDAVGDSRLGPLLARRIHDLGLPVHSAWQHALRTSTLTRLFLEEARQDLGRVFDRESIPWLPLKGMGSISRFYPQQECRPTSDLDILIPPERLKEATCALLSAGWKTGGDLEAGDDDSYNWKARHPNSILLELHFTLWGGAHPDLPAALMARAEAASELGTFALRSRSPELFIIGATHLWNSPRPRPLLYFLELHLLGLGRSSDSATFEPALAEAVIRTAGEFDLQLFIGLSAAISHAIWPDPINGEISRRLIGDLRFFEKLFLKQSGGAPDANLAVMSLARLLSTRKTRKGWSAVPRFLLRSLTTKK